MFQENANKISEKLIAKIINDSMGDPRSRDQYFCIQSRHFVMLKTGLRDAKR